MPSAYQKTVPIEAGESWQAESTVRMRGAVLVPCGLPGMAEGKASPCGVLVRGVGELVLGAAYMYPLSSCHHSF